MKTQTLDCATDLIQPARDANPLIAWDIWYDGEYLTSVTARSSGQAIRLAWDAGYTMDGLEPYLSSNVEWESRA